MYQKPPKAGQTNIKKRVIPLPSLTPGRVIKPRLASAGRTVSDYAKQLGIGMQSPYAVLETVAMFNPDVSLAIWNYLRMIVPVGGINIKVVDQYKELLPVETDRLLERIDDNTAVYGLDYGGGVNQLALVLTLCILMRGAVAGEIEVNEALDDVVDWHPIDPGYIRFDTVNGRYQPYVRQSGKKIYLNRNQFRYIPLDPHVDDPYGCSPLLSTLEIVFFQSEVYRDLKAVAHTSGQPRVHFSVVEDVAMQHVPEYLLDPNRYEELRAWMDSWLKDLSDAYKEIEPDDSFVTWDWVDVKSMSGGKVSVSIDSLLKAVSTQMISAVKQLPVLLGRVEGMGLAHGTIQWEVFVTGIESLQRIIDALITWWATQTIRLWGVNGQVEVEFKKLRVGDRIKEAEADKLERDNALFDYMMGWVSNEELANRFVGHAPVREPSMPKAEPELEQEGKTAHPHTHSRNEMDYVDKLPSWLRRRYAKTAQSMAVYSEVSHESRFGNGNQ